MASEVRFTKKYFYEKYWSAFKGRAEIIAEIEKCASDHGADVTEDTAKNFVRRVSDLWKQCYRKKDVFEKKHADFLAANLYEKQRPVKRASSTSAIEKTFDDLSLSQKRRRTAELRKEDSSALVFASVSALRKNCQCSVASLIPIVVKSPERVRAAIKLHDKVDNISADVNLDKALAIAIDCDLSKHQYEVLRSNCKERTDMFPSYKKLAVAKSRCYPSNITVNDVHAVVALQNLLDHTAARLLVSLNEHNIPENLIFFYKWGFDGSSGHAHYKQIAESTDESVVITTVVPLLITDANHSRIWENPTPSSTRYCRPVRIAFEKETSDRIKSEYDRMCCQISELQPTKVDFKSTEVTIEHRLLLTMVDGKSINVLAGNCASSRCYICRAGPKDLNNLDSEKLSEITNETHLKYGLSPLHARIKFFEFLLHLAYRLNLPEGCQKKGTRLNDEQKEIVEQTKQQVKDQFRDKLGLIVDTPKQGFGSSNDGNTARRFFDNAELSAEILKIDVDLVQRFATILTAINVCKELDSEKFGIFALDTAKLLVQNYAFMTMSPTVHKVLVHGKIIASSIIPIGALSEEALEHRNKDVKSIRCDHARKMSRVTNLTDIFNRCLLTSDPLIACLRSTSKLKKKKRELPLQVQKLLKSTVLPDSSSEDSDE